MISISLNWYVPALGTISPKRIKEVSDDVCVLFPMYTNVLTELKSEEQKDTYSCWAT